MPLGHGQHPLCRTGPPQRSTQLTARMHWMSLQFELAPAAPPFVALPPVEVAPPLLLVLPVLPVLPAPPVATAPPFAALPPVAMAPPLPVEPLAVAVVPVVPVVPPAAEAPPAPLHWMESKLPEGQGQQPSCTMGPPQLVTHSTLRKHSIKRQSALVAFAPPRPSAAPPTAGSSLLVVVAPLPPCADVRAPPVPTVPAVDSPPPR